MGGGLRVMSPPELEVAGRKLLGTAFVLSADPRLSPEPGQVIYLDHHAATPVCAAALRAMEAARAQEPLGNPASVHAAGRAARALLERAREQVAAAIGAKPADVVLTSGGTEACNLGVRGPVDAARTACTW